MDIKFVITVLLVELFSFGLNCWRLITKPNINLFNNHNETTAIPDASGVGNQRSTQVNHCQYNNDNLSDLNLFHLIFAGIEILGYIALIILLCTKKTAKKVTRSNIKLGNVARLTILLATALNSLLIVIHYKIEARLIEECSQPTGSVRLENMTWSLIINILEVAYLLFDFRIEDTVPDRISQNKKPSISAPIIEIPLVPITLEQQEQREEEA